MPGVRSSPAGDYRKVPRSGLILLKALGVAADYGRVVTRRETSQAIDSVSRFLFYFDYNRRPFHQRRSESV